MDQRILLQTADSFLATYTVGEPDMIEQCVAEVKGQLVQRPEFILYDKVCHQIGIWLFFPIHPLAINIRLIWLNQYH